MMPQFILETPNAIPNSTWVPVSNFRSLNEIVLDSGEPAGWEDYGGRHYQIIRKEIYTFSKIERFFRKVIVIAALIFSAGLLWLYKPVRDLWFKDHLSKRYAKQLENETECEIQHGCLYYKNPLLLSEGLQRNEDEFYFAEVRRKGKSSLIVVTKEEQGYVKEYTSRYSGTSYNQILFELAKKSSNSILPIISKLHKPHKFFSYLLCNPRNQRMRLLQLEKTHVLEIFQLFSEKNYSFEFNQLIRIYNYAKVHCEELVVAIETKYPYLKHPLNPLAILPTELMLHIFSYLEVASMGNVMSVNKEWNETAFDLKYFKAGIYQKKAITANKWMRLTQKRLSVHDAKNAEFNSLSDTAIEQFFLRSKVEDCVLIRDLSSVCAVFRDVFKEIISENQEYAEGGTIKWFILPKITYDQLIETAQLNAPPPQAPVFDSILPYSSNRIESTVNSYFPPPIISPTTNFGWGYNAHGMWEFGFQPFGAFF